MCVSAWEIRGENRDLERAVERPQELKGTERAAGVCGKRDPGNNVENFHGKGLAIPRLYRETCVPPDAAPRGTSARRS